MRDAMLFAVDHPGVKVGVVFVNLGCSERDDRREPHLSTSIFLRADARSARQALASSTMLNGVSAPRRSVLNPALVTMSRSRASPACAPRAVPTSWDREHGVQSRVENP